MKQVISAILRMIEQSGEKPPALSRKMGRCDTYLSSMIGHRSTPRADLLAEIAEACGYKLVLEGHGDRIVVLPKPRPDAEQDAERNAERNAVRTQINK